MPFHTRKISNIPLLKSSSKKVSALENSTVSEKKPLQPILPTKIPPQRKKASTQGKKPEGIKTNPEQPTGTYSDYAFSFKKTESPKPDRPSSAKRPDLKKPEQPPISHPPDQSSFMRKFDSVMSRPTSLKKPDQPNLIKKPDLKKPDPTSFIKKPDHSKRSTLIEKRSTLAEKRATTGEKRSVLMDKRYTATEKRSIMTEKKLSTTKPTSIPTAKERPQSEKKPPSTEKQLSDVEEKTLSGLSEKKKTLAEKAVSSLSQKSAAVEKTLSVQTENRSTMTENFFSTLSNNTPSIHNLSSLIDTKSILTVSRETQKQSLYDFKNKKASSQHTKENVTVDYLEILNELNSICFDLPCQNKRPLKNEIERSELKQKIQEIDLKLSSLYEQCQNQLDIQRALMSYSKIQRGRDGDTLNELYDTNEGITMTLNQIQLLQQYKQQLENQDHQATLYHMIYQIESQQTKAQFSYQFIQDIFYKLSELVMVYEFYDDDMDKTMDDVSLGSSRSSVTDDSHFSTKTASTELTYMSNPTLNEEDYHHNFKILRLIDKIAKHLQDKKKNQKVKHQSELELESKSQMREPLNIKLSIKENSPHHESDIKRGKNYDSESVKKSIIHSEQDILAENKKLKKTLQEFKEVIFLDICKESTVKDSKEDVKISLINYIKSIQETYIARESGFILQSASLEVELQKVLKEYNYLTRNMVDFNLQRQKDQHDLKQLKIERHYYLTQWIDQKVCELNESKLRKDFRELMKSVKENHKRDILVELKKQQLLEQELKNIKADIEIKNWEKIDKSVQTNFYVI